MREPYNYAGLPTDSDKQQITIILSRKIDTRDWSVVVNGQRHEHVTTEVLEALVECELILAETSLTDEHHYGPETSVGREAFRR